MGHKIETTVTKGGVVMERDRTTCAKSYSASLVFWCYSFFSIYANVSIAAGLEGGLQASWSWFSIWCYGLFQDQVMIQSVLSLL